jgi:hypothetical protein
MIFDTNPELKAMGRKQPQLPVIDVTVPPISAVPSYAARTRFFPFPCYIFQNYNGIIDEYQLQLINLTNSLSLV